MTTEPRHSDQIMDDFDAAVAGRTDIDPWEILWEILADVQDSYALAMGMDERVDDATAHEIALTVTNYLVNHYGDD